jgi:hypothetical protein
MKLLPNPVSCILASLFTFSKLLLPVTEEMGTDTVENTPLYSLTYTMVGIRRSNNVARWKNVLCKCPKNSFQSDSLLS